MTPTWSGDKAHFDLMRASVEQSALASLRHQVVVQTEDVEQLQAYAAPPVELLSTADVLPAEVENRRQRARRYRNWSGRNVTRILGSIARHTGRPQWVHYTGWHVQLITKLALAAVSDIDNVVAMDSDVVVTPHARVDDFIHPDRIVCFEHWAPAAEANRKVVNWNRQANALWGAHATAGSTIDTYFDTPFLLHAPTVRAMLAQLEERYERPWWRVLLAQPPRRWSEFATYRTFLRLFLDQEKIEWRTDYLSRYIFSASDAHAVCRKFEQFLQDPESHYVTIHSQSSGRQLWGANGYAPLIMRLLRDT